MPTGWTPPPDPRGPVPVPPRVEPERTAPIVEPEKPGGTGTQIEEPVRDPERSTGTIEETRTTTGTVIIDPDIPEPVVKPRRSGIWVALGVLLALLLGAGAWWMWRDTNDVPPVAAETESEDSLESVRRYLASNPDPAAAREKAEKLAANGKLLDAQFLLFKYAAERGDHPAQRHMGVFYDPATWSKEKSPLPAPNPLEAARWHKMAAEDGDAESQYRYGMLLRKGGTDEPNGPEMAVGWLRKAAEQGNAEAKKALEQ
jgi:hypothetical protein